MSLSILDGRRDFWQWDTGQLLLVNDPACGEVHYCDGTEERALVAKIKTLEDGRRAADVPNILLQTYGILVAYLYQEDEHGASTRKDYQFRVLPRPKPEGYVYTETEVLNYSYLDKRLNKLEGEGLANAVADYLEENPIEAGATKEEAAQIAQNKKDIEALTEDKLDATALPTAVNGALTQAKKSGLFDGAPGEKGDPGNDYVLTPADKEEIAALAADLVEVPAPDSGGNVDYSWSDLKDKPFYTETVEEVRFNDAIENDSDVGFENTQWIKPKVKYTAILDGVEYILTGQYADGDSFVGSESLWMGEDYIETEPPFCLGGGWFYTTNEGGTHTLKVVEHKEITHQLDTKYIPNGTFIVQITDNGDGAYTADKTAYDVRDAIDANLNVVYVFNGLQFTPRNKHDGIYADKIILDHLSNKLTYILIIHDTDRLIILSKKYILTSAE